MQRALLYYTLAIQILTFLVWGLDKWKARRGSWRISERSLLLLVLAGGGPGAWAGVRVFRHKSSKGSFLWKLWALSPSVLLLAWAIWRL